MVRLLAARGADLAGRGCWYQLTPLACAAFSDSREMLPTLLDCGARVDFFTAAALGDRRRVARALARNPKRAAQRDGNRMMALHLCAGSGLGRRDRGRGAELARVATLLLDAGAPLEAPANPQEDHTDGDFGRPLYWAAAWGKVPEVLRVLLERGADLSRGSPILEALWGGGEEVAAILHAAGADVDAPGEKGWTPLYTLAHWGRTRMVSWLLAHGADPRTTGANGDTPLHVAARKGMSSALSLIHI